MLTHNTIFVDVAQWTAIGGSATQNGLSHFTTLEESVSPAAGSTYKTQYAYFNASANVSVVGTFKKKFKRQMIRVLHGSMLLQLQRIPQV